jgi:hypothetical protein
MLGGRTASGLRRLVAALIVFASLHTSLASQEIVERPEEELLLLALRSQGVTLADALPAWPTPGGGVMLPLGEVARLLTIAVEVDVTKGLASGFIVSEDRPFLLDAANGRVVVGGRETRFERRFVEVQHDDIYVDASTLRGWIPVDFQIDLRRSLVTAVAREPLPFMRARERKAKLVRAAARAAVSREAYPEQPLTWAAADGFAFDHQSRLSFSRRAGESLTGYQHSTFMAGDLLAHSSELWIIGTDEDPASEIRATLGRRHPEPALLGGLRAREYAAGEIFVPGDDLLINGGSGPGILLSNVPLRRTNEFDSYTIQGTGPSGWDVELYQNDALLTISRVGLDGRYEFQDIPIFFGLNVFRLVFYGPQGQVREETRRLEIAEGLTKKGELTYRIAAADVRTRGDRGQLEIDWGATDRASIRVAVGGGDLETGRDAFLRAGVGAYQGLWYGRLDGAVSGEGGSLLRGALQTRLGGLSLTGEIALLDDFVSEVFRPQFGPMSRRGKARIDGILPRSLLSINFSLDATYEAYETGGDVWTIGNRLSKQFGRTFITHTLTSRIPRDVAPGIETSTQASLIGSRFARGWSVRGEIAYQLDPETKLNTATIQADSYRATNFQYSFGAQRVETADINRLFATVAKTRGSFAWNVSLAWDDRNQWTATAGFGISAILDPLSREWETSARSIGTQGAAALRVFVDRDLDGRFSDGDEPLQDVGFFVDRGSAKVATDASGLALITNLAVETVHEVSISVSTLEDVLLRPATPGVGFYVKRGTPTIVDFPVVLTGEIYGTVTLVSERRSRPGAGLTVELVTEDGRVEQTTQTAYDGFYEMTGVRPGRYLLRIGEEARGRKIERPEPLAVVIPADGAILDGVDLVAGGGE